MEYNGSLDTGYRHFLGWHLAFMDRIIQCTLPHKIEILHYDVLDGLLDFPVDPLYFSIAAFPNHLLQDGRAMIGIYLYFLELSPKLRNHHRNHSNN